ncbi:MAG: hypothetical protein J2P41_22330, partial [Blastocatellia bacterium]|nr:hypothetical protein [Blastocatellia bacterium]
MTLSELALQIEAEPRGDKEVEISGVNSLGSATADEATYIADSTRLQQAEECPAAALIVPLKLADDPRIAGRNLLIARDAKLAFARAISSF